VNIFFVHNKVGQELEITTNQASLNNSVKAIESCGFYPAIKGEGHSMG
jgi:hypothetical protein